MKQAKVGFRYGMAAKQKWKCHYCLKYMNDISGSYLKMTIDHIIPKSAGGGNSKTNLVAACAHCNSRKGSIPYRDYMMFCKIHGHAGKIRSIIRALTEEQYQYNKALYDTIIRYIAPHTQSKARRPFMVRTKRQIHDILWMIPYSRRVIYERDAGGYSCSDTGGGSHQDHPADRSGHGGNPPDEILLGGMSSPEEHGRELFAADGGMGIVCSGPNVRKAGVQGALTWPSAFTS